MRRYKIGTKQFVDISIVSAYKPPNTHLWIEANSSGIIYCVDSGTPTKLYKTTDKGDNWDLITTRTYNIVGAYADLGNDKIYFLDGTRNPGNTDDDFAVWYLDTTDDSINENGAYNNGNDFVGAYDIFILNSAVYVISSYGDGAFPGGNITYAIFKWVDPNWTAQTGTFTVADSASRRVSFCLPVETTDIYFWFYRSLAGVETTFFYNWDSGGGGVMTLLKTHTADAFTYPSGGESQYGIAYDGTDKFYYVLNRNSDSENVLIQYSITAADTTVLGIYDLALMMERNAGSEQEKAFHITNYTIYQLHEELLHQIHLIDVIESDAVSIAITNNFLMNNDGDMFEFQDILAHVVSGQIIMQDMGVPSGTIECDDSFHLAKGQLIRITNMFTTAGASASQTVFEGYVKGFKDRLLQTAILESPAKRDLNEEHPSGDYSGRTDEIIVSLIAAHCKYITAGTLSNGTAMGTITFYGDKTLGLILHELSLVDNFIWYLTPTGALYYNDGTVDTVENFTSASAILDVDYEYGDERYNYVNMKGGYINGAQVSGTAAESTEDQLAYGKKKYEKTFSFLDTSALCTTTNTNILARYDDQALIVYFSHRDSTVGIMQPGETITFEYNETDPNISSAQFGIRNVIYDLKTLIAHYTVSDQIL